MNSSFTAHRVCFVAAPLTARTGVYRSARELVSEARRVGLDWSLVLGISRHAKGKPPLDDPPWITEIATEPRGLGGIKELRSTLLSMPMVSSSEVVVSLIPQTDMALSLTNLRWVAYLRGLPWPDKGEASEVRRRLWRGLERQALKQASGIWATTPMLRDHANLSREVPIVPAGLAPVIRSWDGTGARDRVVWAARYDTDKNPLLFLDAMRGSNLRGVMYGSGPLEAELRRLAPPNVEVAGWVDSSRIWEGALAYAGTSFREAFGRSAVEAAMSGIPVVLANSFGAAPLIVREDAFRKRFVLPPDDPSAWAEAFSDLAGDTVLRERFSDHVAENGAKLTVAESVAAISAALDDRGWRSTV